MFMTKKFPKSKVFNPQNPQKYRGDVKNIISRSSWELAFLWFLDQSPVIKYYASEELVIPYFFPCDNKWHRYFPDFFIEFITGDKFIIEIKPFYQRIIKTQKEEFTFLKNQYKWDAANKVAENNNIQFLVFDEYDLKRLGVKILLSSMKVPKEKLLFEQSNKFGNSLEKFISPIKK